MDANETAIHATLNANALREELLATQARLALLAECWKGKDSKASHALNRASSWLGDVTNPLDTKKTNHWFIKYALEEANAYLEDGRAKELARCVIDDASTDEDKRDVLASLDEEAE